MEERQLVELLRQALSGMSVEDVERLVSSTSPAAYAAALLAEIPRRMGPLYSEKLVARILRREWRSLEPYLASAPRALLLIKRARPDLAHVLARHPRWFNEFVKALYRALYKWAWGS